MENLALPAKWQEWRIVEAIGEGSFGAVYRAEKDDGVVKSVSAIKVVEIAAEDARMAGLSRRYKSEDALRDYLWSVVDHCAEEIRTMYRLQGQSSIVSIQDHAIEALEDRIGWRLFIRMEYLQSFDDYLTIHEFTQRDIIRMGISLCGALERCEKLNILHRDIKRENIFVSPSGEFKLGDFGISRVLEETRASLTSEGTFGTMAPEVYKGQPCGREADIYSLGLVLYTLANRNCEPFIDTEKAMPSYGEMQEAFERRMKGDPLPPPVDASPALSKVLLKACAYKPSARYRSAADFRAALEPLARRQRPSVGRIALVAVIVALAALAAALGPRLIPRATQLLAASQSASPIPAGFEPVDAADPAWRCYGLNDSEVALYYRQAAVNPNAADAFAENAGGLFAYLIRSLGFRIDGEIGPVDVEDGADGLTRAYAAFTRADGWQCGAALIFAPDSGRLHGAVMVASPQADPGAVPDFRALSRALDPEDIDRLFDDAEG